MFTQLKRLLLLAVLFSVSACQQGTSAAQAAYQAKVSKVLGTYVRGISSAYKKVASRNTGRGVNDYQYPSANGLVWPTGMNLPTNNYPGVGQLYGGQLFNGDLIEACEDCKDMSELVPVTDENYDYMVANLARCLDRVIQERNPIFTFANRNMGNYNQNHMGYASAYGMPAPFESWNMSYSNMMNPWMNNGYAPQWGQQGTQPQYY